MTLDRGAPIQLLSGPEADEIAQLETNIQTARKTIEGTGDLEKEVIVLRELSSIFEQILPSAIHQFVPAGWTGLLLAGLAAAFVSTFSGTLNAAQAYVVNDLIKPQSVIPTHANESATTGGIVSAGTKTQRFIDGVKSAKVFVPLSGVTISCDGEGKCSQ